MRHGDSVLNRAKGDRAERGEKITRAGSSGEPLSDVQKDEATRNKRRGEQSGTRGNVIRDQTQHRQVEQQQRQNPNFIDRWFRTCLGGRTRNRQVEQQQRIQQDSNTGPELVNAMRLNTRLVLDTERTRLLGRTRDRDMQEQWQMRQECLDSLPEASRPEYTHNWAFPLPRTHTGIPLGNGVLGALIWGEANSLKITLGRADFWDHRGGLPWTELMTFTTIHDLLVSKDEEHLRAIFQGGPVPEGQPRQPSVLPLGRLELHFPLSWRLTRGSLNLQNGEAVVRLLDEHEHEHETMFNLSIHRPLLHVRLPAAVPLPAIQRLSAWSYVGDYLQSVSFQPPLFFEQQEIAGWVQMRPTDPSLCLGYRAIDQELWITAVYGQENRAAIAAATSSLDKAVTSGAEHLHAENAQWWKTYWEQVPSISIPHQKLSFRYYYGMYRFAGLTAPQGVPATLQGPWIEEYQMPPWQSDYHFNINVQMCYWPAYRGNHLEHLLPLFDMIWNWRDTLRQNARYFVGIDDGLVLPHAVDDRGTCMGGFWSGTIDHGCTAWVAKMMYDYWLYGGDETFLREKAYPFMIGTMRVYEVMLRRDGDRFELPVSVSPEYRSSHIDAWGKNASFQLACIHWLCEALQHAAHVLGEEPRPIWREIQQKLPRACVEGEAGREQIMLWQGTPLEESHRHHSHLAGIAPFDTLDLNDSQWEQIIARSINHWIGEGMGRWSGWCMPWAAMIHTRVGNADAAQLIMEIWERLFTNEGYATLHDVAFPGISLISKGRQEIMQMDAAMSATAAIMEMLLHTRRGVHYLFAGVPQSWRDVSFEKLRTEGSFLLSAQRSQGITREVYIEARRTGGFQLANPWPGTAIVERGEHQEILSGSILPIDMRPGEVVRLYS
jgi:alpha-L-fucosidase 2